MRFGIQEGRGRGDNDDENLPIQRERHFRSVAKKYHFPSTLTQKRKLALVMERTGIHALHGRCMYPETDASLTPRSQLTPTHELIRRNATPPPLLFPYKGYASSNYLETVGEP